jgi:hypothetical protein
MPGMTDAVRDRLRTMLKIRRSRSLPRRGPKPGVGAKIFKGDVRMTVQAGMSHELWRWLQEQGWREIQFRPDRRRYRDVPTAWVTRLIDCAPDEREAVLQSAIALAADRSGQRALSADTAPPAAPQSD